MSNMDIAYRNIVVGRTLFAKVLLDALSRSREALEEAVT